MKIYRIGSEDQQKYAYAAGYQPFEDMAFMDSVGEYKRKMMEESWAMFPKEPGLHVEERASCWPDVMFCGSPPPSCFYSRKVLDSMDANKIAIKRATAIPVGKIAAGKLQTLVPPDYFVIEALSGIRIDYAASGFVVDADGNPDPDAPRPNPPPILQLDPATWSGLDLFCVSNGRGGSPYYLELLCTERVKEIAKQDGWTNVSFQRLRVKGINPFTGLPE